MTDLRLVGDLSNADLIVGVDGRCGRIILDRPKALNALTLPMVRAFCAALDRFENDATVISVAVTSSHRSVFCAGGDIRWVREQRLAGANGDADAFFTEEFALNLRIAEFSKPYVAIIDGLCLGGGLGLSVHGAHCLVTPRAQLGMPEVSIGYFPDIGASYFLNRLPGMLGRYMALTGVDIAAGDAVWSGLASALLQVEKIETLLAQLAEGCVASAAITAVSSPVGEPDLASADGWINRCFAHASAKSMVDALSREAAPDALKAADAMRNGSPASVAITLDLLTQTRNLDLATCLAIELVLAKEITRSADFYEGVRAMLVDKDRTPMWSDVVQAGEPVVTRHGANNTSSGKAGLVP